MTAAASTHHYDAIIIGAGFGGVRALYEMHKLGLSTRLFLKLGDGLRNSFAVLIYPASGPWHPQSSTVLQLFNGAGASVAEVPVTIPCSGSLFVWPHTAFDASALAAAGPDGYVLVRDAVKAERPADAPFPEALAG